MPGEYPPVPAMRTMREQVPDSSAEVEIDKIVVAGCTVRWFHRWKHLSTAFGHCGNTLGCSGNTTVGVSEADSYEISSALKIAALGIGPEIGAKISSQYTKSEQCQKAYSFSYPVPPCFKCRESWWQLIERLEIRAPNPGFFSRQRIKKSEATNVLFVFDSFRLLSEDPDCPDSLCHTPQPKRSKLYEAAGSGFSVITSGVPAWTNQVALHGFGGLYKVGDAIPAEDAEPFSRSSISSQGKPRSAILAEYAEGAPSKRSRLCLMIPGALAGFFVAKMLLALLRREESGESIAAERVEASQGSAARAVMGERVRESAGFSSEQS